MAGPECLVCRIVRTDPPRWDRAVAGLLGGWSRNVAAQDLGVGYGSLRRHLDAEHHGTEPLRDEVTPADPDLVITPGMTHAERLRVVTDMIEKKINGGTARSEDVREYRIALKDLVEIEAQTSGPTTVAIDEVEGLPELFLEIVVALEPWPAARKAVMGALKGKGLEGMLG